VQNGQRRESASACTVYCLSGLGGPCRSLKAHRAGGKWKVKSAERWMGYTVQQIRSKQTFCNVYLYLRFLAPFTAVAVTAAPRTENMNSYGADMSDT